MNSEPEPVAEAPWASQVERMYGWLLWALIAGAIAYATYFRFVEFWEHAVGKDVWRYFFAVNPAQWGERFPAGSPFFTVLTYLFSRVIVVDPVLRLTAFIPSVLALFGLVQLGRVLFNDRIFVLLLVVLFGFHWVPIFGVTNVYPYPMETLAHIIVLIALVSFIRRKAKETALHLTVACMAGCVVGMNLCLILPAAFSLMGVAFTRSNDRRTLMWVAAGAAACMAILVVDYWLFYHGNTQWDYLHRFWGVAFYPGTGSYARWVADRFLQVPAGFALVELEFPSWLTWFIAGIAGVGCIGLGWTKRYEELFALASVYLLVLVFSSLGVWPMNVERMNGFLQVYFLVPIVFGLQFLAKITRSRELLPIASIVLFAVTQHSAVGRYSGWHRTQSLVPAIDELLRLRQTEPASEREVLMLSRHARSTFSWYQQEHSLLSKKLGWVAARGVPVVSVEDPTEIIPTFNDQLQSANEPTTFWFLLSPRFGGAEAQAFGAIFDRFRQDIAVKEFGYSHLVRLDYQPQEPR